MSSSIKILEQEIRATAVWFTKDFLCVRLEDGRELSVPLAWFPRLTKATWEQLNKWEFNGRGVGIHWEELDEDILVEGLLFQIPSRENESFTKKYPLNDLDTSQVAEP